MMQTIEVEIRHAHLFAGLGGGARGGNKGEARVGNMQAKFRCIGGIDVDGAAIKDFHRLSGVRGTQMDLFSLDQYIAFHGKVPPPGWKEATTSDIHKAFNHENPHIIFLSAPCKGFSGLLSETKSKTSKYQALNELTLRGVWLSLEAYKNDPVEFYIFENVPRIASRGKSLLDQIEKMFRSYGYAIALTTHDCGELGGLAQSRKRFLLVARHMKKIPPFLYEPEKRPLLPVGDILGRMPMPGNGIGGAMHRIPSLQWKTWVRLAFVEPGSDWRSLNRLKIVDGKLADYLIMPTHRNGHMGVLDWKEPAGTVAGCSRPGNGAFSIADPRFDQSKLWTDGQAYGVRKWDEPTGTVTSKNVPGQGPYSVADPRVNSDRHGPFGVTPWDKNARTVAGETHPSNGSYSVADPRVGTKKEGDSFYGGGEYGVIDWNGQSGAVKGAASHDNGRFSVADPRMEKGTDENRHKNVYRVVKYEDAAGTVSAGHGPSSGGQCVADPRHGGPAKHSNEYHIVPFSESANTVSGAHGSGQCVADPRPEWGNRYGSNLQVIDWDQHSPVVHGGGKGVQGGGISVADPRVLNREKGDAYLSGGHYGVVDWNEHSGAVSAAAGHDNGRWSVADPRLPEASDHLIAIIRAIDGTWHRPFTTLELAALQSLVEPEEHFELEGLSDSAWRERIGNAVPPKAATAIFSEIGRTFLLALSGETFMLSNTPIWVQQIAIGLSVKQEDQSFYEAME